MKRPSVPTTATISYIYYIILETCRYRYRRGAKTHSKILSVPFFRKFGINTTHTQILCVHARHTAKIHPSFHESNIKVANARVCVRVCVYACGANYTVLRV